MNKPVTHLAHLLAACCLLLVACMPQTIPSVTQSRPAAQTDLSTKGPYNGPVSLKINTGLRTKSQGKVVALSSLEASKKFTIQAAPSGAVVFQESFTKSSGNLEEVSRSFRVSDPSKRYSLHLLKHEPAQGHEGRIQLNLNGSWTIREKDFEGPSLEVLREGLLLNANNSLLLRLRGKTGTRFTLTVVEGGEAGTILRRRGWEKAQNLSQADRLRNNDTNYFLPDDPDSLAGLDPYEGDQLPPDPTGMTVGESLANGTLARIAVGVVTVVMKEPAEANLQALLARFPATVLSQYDSFGDRFVTLEVDFDRIDLSELPVNVQSLNQRPDNPPLTDAVFSSVNTAKTIALAAQLEAQALDLIYGVSLSNLGEKAGAIETQEETTAMPISSDTSTLASLKTPPLVPTQASKLWWLDAIQGREAWNYNMGENATVAVIDNGFGILRNNTGIIQNEPDFKSRVIFSEPGVESYLRNCMTVAGLVIGSDCDRSYNDETLKPGVGITELENKPGHGLWAASVLASGDNDGDGIVGIAPRTRVLPMYHGSGIERPITQQLERLYCGMTLNPNVDICKGHVLPKIPLQVDVVSISLSRTVNAYDFYFANKTYDNIVRQRRGDLPEAILKGTSANTVSTPLIVNLYDAIYRLTKDKKVIIVAAASNRDKGYDRSGGSDATQSAVIPASMNQVLSVGAYQLDGGIPKRAKFDIYTIDDSRSDGAVGSNYGLLVDVYAPGKGLWVQGYDYDSGSYKPRWHVIEGTSFATPLVAGTVAMMKSIDKSLMFADVYNILRDTSTDLTDSSFNFGFTVRHKAHGLNSLKAVEETIKRRSSGDKTAKSYCLQYTFSGAPGSPDRALIDVNSAIPGSGEVVAVLKGEYLTNSLQGLQPGDYVEALGWSQAERASLPPNRLEVIQATKKASGHCQDLSFRISSAPNPLPPPTNFGNNVQGLIYQGLVTQAYGGQTLAIPAEGNLNNATVRIGETLAEEISTRSDAVLFKLPLNLTPGRYDIHLSTDGGSVTLAAVLDYQRSLPNDYVFGLFAKLYANTDVIPVETMINTLTPGGAQPYKPSAVVIVPNLALNPVTNDAFGVGLQNFYVADIQGTLTVEAGQEGQYDFALLHDDGALLEIDGQLIIDAGRYPTAPEVMSLGTKNLSAGMHTIRVQRYQYTGRDPLILSWRKPNTTEFEVIPLQAFSHATSIQTSADSQLKPGVLGRFFGDVSAEPPNKPYGSKLYDQLNFTDYAQTAGDPFGIGRTDHFAGLFSGYLKLPAGYTAGTYKLVVGHDDGFYFYLDGELKANAPGPTGYIEHTVEVLLEPGKTYPYLLHYHEYTGSAILGFYWVKPDGTRELIPAEAYWR